MVEEDRKSQRTTDYALQLASLKPAPLIQITFGGDPRIALKMLLRETTGQGDHYVYLHRDDEGRVFYVGKGVGRRAWSHDRDEVWHHYVKTRCKGEHEVEIVHYFETEDEALDYEGHCMALFSETIVNHAHARRTYDYPTLKRFHSLRKANWSEIKRAASLDPHAAERLLRTCIASIAEYARLDWEEGDLAASIRKEIQPWYGCHLCAADIAALDKLTMLPKSQGRHDEIVKVSDEFFALYPEVMRQGISGRIAKRAEVSRKQMTA